MPDGQFSQPPWTVIPDTSPESVLPKRRKKPAFSLDAIDSRIILGSFVVVGVLVIAGFFFVQSTHKSLFPTLTPAKNAVFTSDDQTLVEKVGRHIDLPQNEKPNIATVTDKTKLDTQPFFVNAQNGDKLLLYTQAAKAILYRPSTDKIIAAGPYTVHQPTPQVAGDQTSTASISPTFLISPTAAAKPLFVPQHRVIHLSPVTTTP